MLPEIWRNRAYPAGSIMDDLVESFITGWPKNDLSAETGWSPRVDIHETEKEILLDIEVPGLSKKDIAIEVKNNTLTVSGERTYEREVKEGDTSRFERRHGAFERSFGLPETVDAESIEAAYKNGVLTLTLIKKAQPLPKQITINVE